MAVPRFNVDFSVTICECDENEKICVMAEVGQTKRTRRVETNICFSNLQDAVLL